jgi:hypothetical protein
MLSTSSTDLSKPRSSFILFSGGGGGGGGFTQNTQMILFSRVLLCTSHYDNDIVARQDAEYEFCEVRILGLGVRFWKERRKQAIGTRIDVGTQNETQEERESERRRTRA